MTESELKEVKGRLEGKSTNAYIRYLNIMRSDLCLVRQYKIENGLITDENIKAFEDGYRLLGKHEAYIEILNLLNSFE